VKWKAFPLPQRAEQPEADQNHYQVKQKEVNMLNPSLRMLSVHDWHPSHFFFVLSITIA
jgi:hypothetical protein